MSVGGGEQVGLRAFPAVSYLAVFIAEICIGLSPAAAQPTGGVIVAGQASIGTPSANSTLITQSSQKAVIDWQSFSVGSGASVQFVQPNSAAITLNRVTGGDTSAIEGAMRANGQVWLINPNGVLFGQGANIHIGGLLATTADIANGDFLSGNYSFSASTSAPVINQGSIHAAMGGSVVLSGRSVSNTGIIEARAGHVVLGGADAFTVDFAGDNLLSYAVTTPVAATTKDKNGNSISASVSNTGIIRAPGGKVLLTARAAAGVADGVVNNTGTITATTAHMENGEVVLDAGDGDVADSGTLDASGKAAGATGGSVQVLGKTVTVADGSRIDVSGDAGGGEVLIGGNFHGAGPQANAQTTTVGKAVITADAIHSGNGGKVAVWSNGNTRFAGSISAKGGAASGNGGQIETSGQTLTVSPDGRVSTLAVHGVSGNWLLDPHNITISNSGGSAVTPETYSTNPSTDAIIDPTVLANALASGSVTLQANTDITVASSISVNGGSGNSLSLQAGRSIALTNSSSINFSAGNVSLTANDPNAMAAYRDAGLATISGGTVGGITAAKVSLVLDSNGQDGSSIGSSGTPFLVAGSSPTLIQTSGANAFVTGGDGVSSSFTLGIVNGATAVNLMGGNLSIKAAGVTQLGPISVNDLTVTLPVSISSGNPVLFSDAGNVISGTVNIAAMGTMANSDFIQVINSQALTIGTINDTPNMNSTDRGSMTLTATNGGLTLTGDIDTGLITLNAQGDITQTGGVLDSHVNTAGGAGGLAINATNDGSISLPDANILEQVVTGANLATSVTAVGQLVFISSLGATINFASSLQLQGAYASNGDVSITTTGTYNLSDANGNTIKKYSEIDINNPITATGLVTLHAAGDVVQEIGPSSNVAITAPSGLIATSDMGQLVLSDGGHAANSANCGQVCPADAGNQVGGYALLNAATNAAFTNTISTTLGIPGNDSPQTSVIGGNLDVEVTDANQDVPNNGHAILTMNGRVHTQQTMASGDTVLHASGDIINNLGNGTITATNLSLVSDNGTVGASSPSTPNIAYAFGDGRDGPGSLNLHASAPNGSILINPGDLNIGTDLAGPGLQAQSILIFGNGVITQNADSTGTIITPSFDAHASSNITLTNPNNAASTVAFTTGGTATFYNSVQTTINRGSADHDINGNELPMGNLDLEVADPSGNTFPGIFVQGNSVTDSIDSSGTVTLHAAGAITSSTNPIIGSSVTLVSDTAGIGTPSAPMLVTAGILVATSSNQDIIIKASGQNGMLTVGNGTTGINAGTGNVALIADGSQVSGTDTITANNLRVSGQSITLGDVEVATLNANSVGGAISITSNGAFMLDNITGAPGTAAINSNGGNVHLTAAGGISQATGTAGAILAGGLDADPAQGASLTFDNPGNQVTGNVTLRAVSNVTFANAINTLLGTSSAGGIFTAVSAGNLTIVSGATLTAGAGGNALVLSAAGNFINNAGSSALSLTGGGRFLIYSAGPANDVFGSLDSANTAIWNTAYPTAITASGNRYVFAYQPIITVAAGNLSKTYGVDDSAAIAADYTITGLQGGVANAFLGDTAASVYSGTPTVTAAGGTTAQAAVGNYNLNVGGTVTTMDGYALSLQNGTLSVNPAILTYTADSASRAFGAANPAFTGSVTGFVNGETQASATTGSLSFTSPAQASSAAGLYGIFGSGLKAGNYLFQQAPSNSAALIIVASSNPGATTTGTGTTTPNNTNPGTNSAAQVGATPSFQSFYVSNQSAVAPNGAGFQYASAGPADGSDAISVPITSAVLAALPQITGNPIEDLAQANPGDDSTDPPTSSDLDTNYLAASLNGGPSGKKAGNGGIIIPGLLKATAGSTQTVAVSGNDLSGWGNSALWQ